MSRIKIENIGPVKNVDFNLNKVNIIMGPQSSGKSTIAKIISFCQWVEKRFILDGDFKYSFSEQFINFHRVSEEYFSKDSLIEYESDFIKFSYKGNKHKFLIDKKKDFSNYSKSKNIYIPAERNFVSVIPNLGKYKETNDNIMSFLYDWYDTKKKYSKLKKLPILNLNIEYYHIEDSDSDVLRLNKSKKEISLKNASSGLQSVIPLTMLVDYLSNDFFDEKISNSVDEKEEIKKVFLSNFPYIMDNLERMNELTKSLKIGSNEIELNENEFSKIINLMKLRSKYYYSSFIIEEPEQNLYPETQRDFIYFLLKNINNKDRNHQALLTTHSPFILYALNNCMMGYKVSDNLTEDEKNELLSYNSWINPDLVSVWEIDKNNGTLINIKDPKTGTISKNFFNQFTNELMNEYYEMLSVL
mgnify:CR=1 FL=1